MDNGASSYRRFLEGDDNGIAEIIDRYCDGLILYLTSFTRNTADAEDLAEDTFVKLAIKKPKYNGKASFRTWLYRIGHNIAVDRIRKNFREIPVDFTDYDIQTAELENSYIREENKILVHRALLKLSGDHMQILSLVYFEGMSAEEASKVIGKSRRATESLLFRAKNALKTQLEKDGFVYEDT